jgi:hypothetical protein
MNHPETHIIRPEDKRCGERPCFYCKGETIHDPECVLRRRTVVIRYTVEYAIAVPEHWDVEQINFHRNESSWCQGNALHELAELTGHDLVERPELQDECDCGCFATIEYVREADPGDETKAPPRTWTDGMVQVPTRRIACPNGSLEPAAAEAVGCALTLGHPGIANRGQ